MRADRVLRPLFGALLLTGFLQGCVSVPTLERDDVTLASNNSRSGSKSGKVAVESVPEGAEVLIMGKRVGKTPTMINPADAYPVSYSLDKEKYYGRVVLRKKGCKEFSRRLTRGDTKQGLKALLECDTAVPGTRVGSSGGRVLRPGSTVPKAENIYSNLPAEKRLQQLRVLQQLQEEGMMTEEQEKKLRKRILDAE